MVRGYTARCPSPRRKSGRRRAGRHILTGGCKPSLAIHSGPNLEINGTARSGLPERCACGFPIMGPEQVPYHPRYLAGVLLFNEQAYFEAHEVWEDLWAESYGPERKFYQGLIQAAVGLCHF